MDGYLTPAGRGEAELTEKKSRFIGWVCPAASEREALALLDEARRSFPDATHHVWAYVLREGNAVRFSDDGEPGGTAGQPCVSVFLKGGVTDAVCVVTRYFGGTLLGAGGLVRAYSAAAKKALDSAGLKTMSTWLRLGITCSYSLYERAARLLGEYAAVTEDAVFAGEVTVTALIAERDAEAFRARLQNLSAGTARCETRARLFR